MATKTNAAKTTIKGNGKGAAKGNGAAKAKGFANPFRDGSNYHAIVATLEGMGANKPHPYADFEKRIQKEWKGWGEFSTRKARKGVEVHHDALGKLRVNVGVLQRADYGKPLHDLGACIDLTRDDKGALLIMLNTHSNSPKTPGRAPSTPKPQTEKKSAEKKAKPNANKPKPSASALPILSGRDALRHLATKGNGIKKGKAA